MTITMTANSNVVERLLEDRPAFHMGGDARWDSLPETLAAVQRAARPGLTTLETGTGCTTVVFTASGANHTAISPDPIEHERIRDYCRQIGVDDSRLQFVVGSSEDILPSLVTRQRTVDVAYIDGAHCFPLPHVDWCYMTRSLKLGGTLIMDDISIPSITPLFRHMTLEPNWRLERTLDDRAAEFTLLAEPPGDDPWLKEGLNAHYPDYGFASIPNRIRLKSTYKVVQAGRSVMRRSPTLSRAYHRVKDMAGS